MLIFLLLIYPTNNFFMNLDKSTISKCSLASIAAVSTFTQFTGSTTRSLFRYDITSIINKHEVSFFY